MAASDIEAILNNAAQLTPAIVLGMYLICKVVGLIETWPERQNQKVIRDMFRESTRELIGLGKKMVSFSDNISHLCENLKVLPNQISRIEQHLDKVVENLKRD